VVVHKKQLQDEMAKITSIPLQTIWIQPKLIDETAPASSAVEMNGAIAWSPVRVAVDIDGELVGSFAVGDEGADSHHKCQCVG
jgi:hypothetical protein